MRLKGKKALLTGGSNGIGNAIAHAFLREGATVLFTYRNDAEAAETLLASRSRYHGEIHSFRCDLREADAVDRLCAQAMTTLGSIDILVNNVGISTRDEFLAITPEVFDRVFTANLKAPFFLSQSVARSMIAKASGGSIIHISSLSALRARSAMAHYQCSKAAVIALSNSLAFELGRYGIRSNVISPGLTATKANRDQWQGNPELWQSRAAGIPLSRTGVPQDLAGAAVFLASDESSWVTGANIIVDGGMSVV